MKNSTHLDESEIVEAVENLTVEIKGIEAALRETNQCVPQLDLPGETDIIARHEVLTAHADLLRVMAKAKGIALPKLSSPTSTTGAAYSPGAKVDPSARTSISAGSVATSTQKILVAENVNSLEGLAEKRKQERYDSYATQRKRISKASILIGVLFLALAFGVPALAQDSKAYTLLNGGTNKVTFLATNATLYLACDEYNSLGLQASGASIAGSTSNVVFWIYRTVNSDVQETSPFSALVLPLNGTLTNTVIIDLNVKGAASIRIVPANTNTAGFATNLSLVARFKSPKIKQAQ